MIQYLEIDANGLVVAVFNRPDAPDVVPPMAPPVWFDEAPAPTEEGNRVELNPSPFAIWPAGPTERVYFVDGAVEVRDARALSDTIAAAVLEVDRHADVARAAVVGDAVRVKEYERAQQQAEEFKAAGYAGAAPSCVACWATAKTWTPQVAADDILAAAARWTGALDAIRALRLQAKEDIKRAAGNGAVDARLATFIATLNAAMQGVQ